MQTRRRPAGEDRAAAGIRLRRRVLVAKTALVALAGVVAELACRPFAARPAGREAAAPLPTRSPAPGPAPRPTAAPALAPTAGPPLASPLVIVNATFIDGTGAPPVPAAALLIEGDRLRRVVVGSPGAAAGLPVPDGSRVLDAAGLTVLPGLIDTHVHYADWMAPLFLRFGVTTVRDVGNNPDYLLGRREQERQGQLAAPHLVVHGPLLDGFPPTWPAITVQPKTPDEARRVAARLLDQGVDGLKVYRMLPLDLVQAVCAVAHERDVPVAAHLQVVGAREAAEAGVRSIEHATGINFTPAAGPHDALIEALLAQGVFLPATLLVEENYALLRSLQNRAERGELPDLALVPDGVARGWRNRSGSGRLSIDELTRKAAFVAAFRAAGGRVAAGSDTPNPFVVPGASLHQELELLVAAGLSPLEAIRAATGTAAELLRRPDLGVIAEGKLADLVLVAGDPAERIGATRDVRVVLKGGAVVYAAPEAPAPTPA